MNQLLFLIFLSVVGPIIGSFIGVLKKPSEKSIFSYLSFAAGIMIGVPIINLIPEGYQLSSAGILVLGLLFGFVSMVVIERIIPHIHLSSTHHGKSARMEKTALLLIVGLFIHNFPEGMAIGIGSTANFSLSLVVALAIALHDIPEGICSSAPYYYSTGKRLHSFLVSCSTTIPTLIGFLLTYHFLSDISDGLSGFLIGATAGVMLHLATLELIPASRMGRENPLGMLYLIAGFFTVTLFLII